MYVVQNEHLVQSDVVFLKLLWMQAASKSYHGSPNSHNNLTRNPCLDGDVAQKTWGYHVCVSYTCGYNHYSWNHIFLDINTS
jgi:hypothetical protein